MRPFRAFLWRFEENVAIALLAALLAVLAAQVFTRYVLGNALDWTEEVARYLYVYVVFFGSSAAIQDRGHVSIAMLVNRLPRRAQLATALFVNAAILVALAFLVWWGTRATIRMLDILTITLEVPFAYVYVVVPFTCLLMSWRTILQMREDVSLYRQGQAADMTSRNVI
jgi:TRAP-type transport system small permease protein